MKRSSTTEHFLAPKISIVMPVYNGARYLNEAIASIRNQTYSNWELIIVNDGSSDSTGEIIRQHSEADSRIQYVYHQRNLGLVASLNDGLELASGDLIARHDADDLSTADRIEKMVYWLNQQSDVGLLGSNGYYIDEVGSVVRSSNFPTDHDAILEKVFRDETPFFHGSWIFRRLCLERVGGYNSLLYSGEDKDYLIRVSEQFRVAMHPEKLYYYRFHDGAFTSGPKLRRKLMRKFLLTLAQERRHKGSDSIGLKFGSRLNNDKIAANVRSSIGHLLDAAESMEKQRALPGLVSLSKAFLSGLGKLVILKLCWFLAATQTGTFFKKVALKTRRLIGHGFSKESRST